MANLSDWLGTLAAPPESETAEETAPGWLAMLGGVGEFREAAPFSAPTEPAPTPPPDPQSAVPDPLAEAVARAFAEGERAGRAAAEAEGEARLARHRALRLNFRALDKAASDVLADDLAATVAHLCEGVLGEAARDPVALRERCIAAARRIGGAADALVLHLHPDDIALLDDEALASWRITPDPALEPGSVLVEGPDGTASDGPAEWRRALAAAVRG